MVAAIEESKDLSVFSFEQAHESRLNRSLERNEEKAFQVKEVAPKAKETESLSSRGRGRGGFRGRGHGRG